MYALHTKNFMYVFCLHEGWHVPVDTGTYFIKNVLHDKDVHCIIIYAFNAGVRMYVITRSCAFHAFICPFLRSGSNVAFQIQLFRERLLEKVYATIPERYCRWFWIHCFSKKFKRTTREAMDVCLRVLKESNKSRFDSYSVRNSALIISHVTFRDCRLHIFSDNFSRSSCICVKFNANKGNLLFLPICIRVDTWEMVLHRHT